MSQSKKKRIWVEAPFYNRLEKLAKAQGKSMDQFVDDLCIKILKDLEK